MKIKLNINWDIFFTEKVYRLVRTAGKSFVMAKFKPIVLNKEVVPKDGPIIFTPNHRQTLDPFFIVATEKTPIHWAALKRFFTAKDSIFNNSKNPILCKFTALLFRGIGAVPIDREKSNFDSVKKLNAYLREGSSVGIFPEGTTNKKPEEQDLLPLHLDLLRLAQRNDAWIQPISIVWTPKGSGLKNRVIINFRSPYKVGEMKREEASTILTDALQSGIDENKKIISNLQEIEDIVSNTEQEKTLKLTIK